MISVGLFLASHTFHLKNSTVYRLNVIAEWFGKFKHSWSPRFVWPLLEQRRAAEDPVDQSVADNISVRSYREETEGEGEREREREGEELAAHDHTGYPVTDQLEHS